MDARLNQAWWLLRIVLGLGALVAGLDKFFGLLADWGMYMSPLAERFLPFGAPLFMRMAGVLEMVVGLMVLAGFTRWGGYIIMVWLLLITANLLTTGMFYDLAMRDVEMAAGACALARLSEYRQEVCTGRRHERAVQATHA